MELPTPATLVFNGKTYRVPPLGLADLVEHAKWLRDAHMDEAKRQMVGLPEVLAKHAYDAARTEASRIKLGLPEYRDAAFELQGLAHALWLSVRKEQPDLTIGTVYDIFKADFASASQAAAEALGFVRSDPTRPVNPAAPNP